MTNVNLSRIHNMIATGKQDLAALASRLDEVRDRFVFKIFENTTDADLAAFREKVALQRALFGDLLKKMRTIQDYLEYLKNRLAEGNKKFGVDKKLLEETGLRQKFNLEQRIFERIRKSRNNQLDEIKDVSYYKTAFTDAVKYYDLDIYMFDGNDYQKTLDKLDDLKKKIDQANDEIATLNQTCTMEIMTLDEFAAQNLGGK